MWLASFIIILLFGDAMSKAQAGTKKVNGSIDKKGHYRRGTVKLESNPTTPIWPKKRSSRAPRAES